MIEKVEQAEAVISGVLPSMPPGVPVDTPEILEAVQVKLRSLNYVNAGPPDGTLGMKTEAAILDFRNRNKLPLTTSIDAAFLKTLRDYAPPKELPLDQVTATEAEIAPKVDAVKKNILTRFVAKVSAIPAFVGALLVGIVNNLGDAIETLTPLKTLMNDWLDDIDRSTLVIFAFAATATVSGLLWLHSRQTGAALTDAYQKGTTGNDNKEAPE